MTTAGKRMKLPLMGNIPKAYPSYSEILHAQLGGESFNSMSPREKMLNFEDHRPRRKRPTGETARFRVRWPKKRRFNG